MRILAKRLSRIHFNSRQKTIPMTYPTDIRDVETIDRGTRVRALLASGIGSTIEWYDFILYGTMAAIVFGPLFFPARDPSVALMLSFASFALAFAMRPIGGIIFSHIGDRIGRKKTLVMTLSLMGGSTMAMGLLPDYNAIGVWAPNLVPVEFLRSLMIEVGQRKSLHDGCSIDQHPPVSDRHPVSRYARDFLEDVPFLKTSECAARLPEQQVSVMDHVRSLVDEQRNVKIRQTPFALRIEANRDHRLAPEAEHDKQQSE
jgi:hypothetical protein